MIGLKRTGKSCRLRWVNYLHPGLKRGKMTPHEEKLVLELHVQWGNRWSRIARRLPGRTDNEIKNYWRTHMRKKAQEGKQTASPASPSSSSHSSSLSSTNAPVNSKTSLGTSTSSLHSTRVLESATQGQKYQKDKGADKDELYSIDDIWKDITAEDEPIKPVNDGYSEGSNFSCPSMSSPIWDNLWKLDEDESKIFFSTNDRFVACYENKNISPTS